jgi:hypothetical protein
MFVFSRNAQLNCIDLGDIASLRAVALCLRTSDGRVFSHSIFPLFIELVDQSVLIFGSTISTRSTMLVGANTMITSSSGEEFGDSIGHSLSTGGKEDHEHVLDQQRNVSWCWVCV